MVRKYNPLGAARWFLFHAKKMSRGYTPVQNVFSGLDQKLLRYQEELDHRQFDVLHGTDTGRIISLSNMTINSRNTAEGLWYEALSPRIFQQFMSHLALSPDGFTFIDFGSGKGRVLMLAAQAGFHKLIGVEFAREMHEIAIANSILFNRSRTVPANFEFYHMDAVNFPLPVAPLVIFFYCPFLGNVMEHVLANIRKSEEDHPRPILLLFYGQNPAVIRQFQSIGFQSREIKLKRDWTRFMHYRGVVFYSPAAAALVTT